MLETVMVNLKVLCSLLDHVSGGDVAELVAKLVTMDELDTIVDTFGAVSVKVKKITIDDTRNQDGGNVGVTEVTNDNEGESVDSGVVGDISDVVTVVGDVVGDQVGVDDVTLIHKRNSNNEAYNSMGSSYNNMLQSLAGIPNGGETVHILSQLSPVNKMDCSDETIKCCEDLTK